MAHPSISRFSRVQQYQTAECYRQRCGIQLPQLQDADRIPKFYIICSVFGTISRALPMNLSLSSLTQEHYTTIRLTSLCLPACQ